MIGTLAFLGNLGVSIFSTSVLTGSFTHKKHGWIRLFDECDGQILLVLADLGHE